MSHNHPKCAICGFPTFRQKNALYCENCAKLIRKLSADKNRKRKRKIALKGRLKEIGKALEGVLEEWTYGR